MHQKEMREMMKETSAKYQKQMSSMMGRSFRWRKRVKRGKGMRESISARCQSKGGSEDDDEMVFIN